MTPLLKAQDTTTDPEWLRELAAHEDVPVRRAVTRNRRTPPEVLFALGEVFPAELSQNPALVDLAERAPEYFWCMPVGTVRMLLTLPRLSADLWALLASHEDMSMRMEVLSHHRAPPHVLTAVARLAPPRACCAIAANPSAPPALLEELSRHAESSVRRAVAGNPSAPPDVLEALGRDDGEWVRCSVAANPHTPRAALERLGDDRSIRVAVRLAENPAVPEAVLERFARHISLRSNVACNPSTPPRLFPVLLKDDLYQASAAVARNPRAPEEVLRKLAKSERDEVLEALTANPAAPADLLREIQNRRAAREDAPRRTADFTLPAGTLPFYSGRNFRIYRVEHEGKPRCLKVPVAASNLGVFEADRIVGGVSTVWNLQCTLGSAPRSVRWVSPEAMLRSEAQRLAESGGTWNHQAIAFVWCDVGGDVVPGLITPWHEGQPIGAFPRAAQRKLFPRMLPSFWAALAAARHGDLHPGNILLAPGEERFHLIDPGAMVVRDLGEQGPCSSEKHLSFVTNAEHYPLLPPYYTPDFSLRRGDSLRGHWERYIWSFSLFRMAPPTPTIYQNVLMRAVNPTSGDFIDEGIRPLGEPCPADLLALGILYYRLLTGVSPFPGLAQPAWSQISTLDDHISGTAGAERELDRGIPPPRSLQADITPEEERLALALLDLQVVSREHLHSLSYEAAASVQRL